MIDEMPLLPVLEDFEHEEINIPILVSKNQDIPIVQKLKYCFYNRIPFEERKGIKSIYSSTERIPYTQDRSKKMKEWYASENMPSYPSGEYSVPKDFAKFLFLDQVIFNENCTSFTIDRYKSNFKNEIEKKEHALAVEYYMKKHYRGSAEEAEDIAKENIKKDQMRKSLAVAVEQEIEYLDGGLELGIPSGCRIVNMITHVGLQLNTYEGYIAALENGIYDMFDDQIVKYGVEYKIVRNYYTSWDSSCEDPYNAAIASLQNWFNIIEECRDEISAKTIEILKENLKERANKLLRHYMGKVEIAEKDEISVMQMVEDFFETQGITAETILPKPIVLPKRIQGYSYDNDSKHDYEW